MAAIPGEFEDGGEEEFTLPLPPEDRLWRHPSELGKDDFTLRLDPTMVRNRWLSSQPSRASAWTAGLVGALLASGLVVLGTHLATALTGAPASTAAKIQPVVESAPQATVALSGGAFATALGASVAANVRNVGRAVVTIDAASPRGDVRQLGVVIASNGTVLTAAPAVVGATSVLITLPGNEVVAAVSIAPDTESGLAVLRVNGVSGLATASLAPARVGASNYVVAVTAAGGGTDALGDVRELDVSPRLGTGALVDAMITDLPNTSPPGSPVLNASGKVVGLVAGSSPSFTAVVPSWIALPVSEQLMTTGKVEHGWIGITGENGGAKVVGALVKSVDPNSAGAEAGIHPGDVITALDGRAVRSMAALKGTLYALPPGANVVVEFTADGAHLTRRMRLDDQAAA